MESVNRAVLNGLAPQEVIVMIQKGEEQEAELDGRWSYLQRKAHQRWVWHALDPNRGTILAYPFGDHKDEVFLKLQPLREPFGITRFYPADGGPMNVTCHPKGMPSVKRIPKSSHENT